MRDSLVNSSSSNFYRKKNYAEKAVEEETEYRIKICSEKLKFELPVPSTCKPLTYLWSSFYTQEEAFRYRDSLGLNNLRLFSRERIKEGSSVFSYTVTNIESFWFRYKNLKMNERHYYEIITKNTPCRLYMDLEFEKQFNKDLNGDDLTNKLIEYVSMKLQSLYGVSVKKNDFLCLYSSSDLKYSSHVILASQFPYYFLDNFEVGKFMSEISSDAPSLFFVNSKNEKSTFFADLSVYSKNRSFRLFMSSKMSKGIPLKSAPISNFRESSSTCYNIFLFSLVIPLKIDGEILHRYTFHTMVPKFSTRLNYSTYNKDKTYSLNCELDKYVQNELNNCMEQPYIIKTRNHILSKNIVRYEVDKSRFCYRIDREHRSNHVYLVADLMRLSFHQLCYDVECSGYVSPPLFSIPQELAIKSSEPVLPENYENFCIEEELSDQDLLDVAEAFESRAN